MADRITLPNPALVAVAPNGARLSKSDHPEIPLTPTELAREAIRCRDAGAGLIHLHGRDDAGRRSLSPDRVRPAYDAVRESVGDTMIVQITTEDVGRNGPAEQMTVVRAIKPYTASFALRELIPDEANEDAARDFFGWIADAEILLQFILYNRADALTLRRLIARKVIPLGRPPVLFVFGRNRQELHADIAELGGFRTAWLQEGHWSVCAFGVAETAVAAAALEAGGHVLIGFENNRHRPDGTLARSNAEQVQRIACIAALLGREPATGFETSRRGHSPPVEPDRSSRPALNVR